MRLLLSWVSDFVDVKASAEEVAATLALRGFEVASIEPVGGGAAGDAVIDFEVTANRPDCLSVLGFAREIATAWNLPVRLPSTDAASTVRLAPVTTGQNDRLTVTVEDAELCPRYSAAVAAVTPADTPGWMSRRLQAAGVRPISSIVDITNYVLMELGHPLHAFDLSTLQGSELRIRRARTGEAMTTLDGVKRTLEPDMLVIADGSRAQAVAGVMGGGDSEVSATTQTVAFESAYFKPASIRRTSKRMGLKTEASSRFERGADANATIVALQRVLALMEQIGAGLPVGAVIDRYPAPRGSVRIALRRQRLSLLLGIAVPDADVARILTGLGLAAAASADGWTVEVPTFRVDLTREVDLIEEVGRHYGFDRIEAAFPPMRTAAAPPDARIPRDRALRRALGGAGLSEAVTFGFIEARAADMFGHDPALGRPDDAVRVANPLSATFDTLRPSLLPGLVDAVAHNRRHGRRDVALFEIGARFTKSGGESRGLGLALTGAASAEHWSAPARDVDFFDAKGGVERVCRVLGVEPSFEPVVLPYLAAGQSAVVVHNGARVGVVGLVAPGLAEARGVPAHDAVYVAELNLDLLPLGQDESTAVRPLPRHPFVVRDLSILVPESLPAAIIHGTIQSAGDASSVPLVSIAFFDRYTGKGVAPGTVSLSIRLTFQAADRTLTDADVQHSFDHILAALVREHQAVQR